ncbi:MAG TPA: hypothetical protein VFZ34_17990 [Blastocatellia bacterium]|nr:hypothetical protein [Blastocatellia bacterium]
MNNKMTGIKKALTVALIATVGSFNSVALSSAMAQVTLKQAGDLSVRGTVTLNGMNTASGATVFDGGRIKTGNNGAATVNLGKQGQIELGADSELVLKLEDGVIGGSLRAGRAVVSTQTGVGINILTADGLVATEGREAAILSVDVVCGNTRVTSTKSEAKITAGSRVEVVAAGQEVAVGAQTNQAPNCQRLAVTAPAASLAPALFPLLLVGIAGGVVGLVAATQGDDTTPSSVNVSGFRP